MKQVMKDALEILVLAIVVGCVTMAVGLFVPMLLSILF